MLAQLTSSQISEWIAYNKIDPIGEWRTDYHFAMVCATITNIGNQLVYVMAKLWSKRGIKKPKLVKISDFVPDWDSSKLTPPKKEQTVEEQKAILEKWAVIFKATRNKRKRK